MDFDSSKCIFIFKEMNELLVLNNIRFKLFQITYNRLIAFMSYSFFMKANFKFKQRALTQAKAKKFE